MSTVRVNESALWNSPRGYSLPDERVKVVVVTEKMAQIESLPDEGERFGAAYYWVALDELTAVPA